MDSDRKDSPESSALVIVDMQAEGCERHGPTLTPIIKNIRSLLDRFREANGNVIHVQSVRDKNHPEFTVFGKEYSLIENTPAVEFIEELKPLPNEIVVQKFSHDCFYQTTMEQQLRRLDLRPCRDRIIVTGIGSNNCVYHAVIGFHIRNYFVTVPEDCIHASRADGQQFALNQFRSSAYNFNINVNRSGDFRLQPSTRERALT
ncbi:MAG: isochorismatase family protein [Deltaproteobacteria bacterium]|nr:isochorismatase family protein [Deltaproteobacteria bacterium]